MKVQERLAGAPISWGVCELPGWGEWLSTGTVLGQMAELGLRGTELGAPGFLPEEPDELRRVLEHHGLSPAGAFVALVLHERTLDRALEPALATARLLAATGGQMLVVAAVQDERWSSPAALDRDDWRRLGAHLRAVEEAVGELGVSTALHPHFGSLVETADEVKRALEVSNTGWCLDTGHMLIGGVDPAQFVDEHGERVVHLHLKDVDSRHGPAPRTGPDALQQATRDGLFVALGQGEAPIEAVLGALDRHGYDGWLVLEQDTAIIADGEALPGGPVADARASIAFLEQIAGRTQETPA